MAGLTALAPASATNTVHIHVAGLTGLTRAWRGKCCAYGGVHPHANTQCQCIHDGAHSHRCTRYHMHHDTIHTITPSCLIVLHYSWGHPRDTHGLLRMHIPSLIAREMHVPRGVATMNCPNRHNIPSVIHNDQSQRALDRKVLKICARFHISVP